MNESSPTCSRMLAACCQDDRAIEVGQKNLLTDWQRRLCLSAASANVLTPQNIVFYVKDAYRGT